MPDFGTPIGPCRPRPPRRQGSQDRWEIGLDLVSPSLVRLANKSCPPPLAECFPVQASSPKFPGRTYRHLGASCCNPGGSSNAGVPDVCRSVPRRQGVRGFGCVCQVTRDQSQRCEIFLVALRSPPAPAPPRRAFALPHRRSENGERGFCGRRDENTPMQPCTCVAPCVASPTGRVALPVAVVASDVQIWQVHVASLVASSCRTEWALFPERAFCPLS